MKVTGTSTLTADRQAVFRALQDPEVLVRAIPGCRRLEALGPDAYAMTVAAGVGAIKGVYDGQVRLTDQQEPESFTLHAQGAGAAGTIGADVAVTLQDAAGGGTELTYDADAVVGGVIGGVGQRMLVGVSKRLAGEFFANVDVLVRQGAAGGRTDGLAAAVAGPGGRREAPDGPAAAGPAGRPVVAGDRPRMPEVYAAPGRAPREWSGFVVGVAVGAAAALAGAVVGGWIGRRSASGA